jgi:hypothetical protein
MKPQFDNFVASSMILFLDNKICSIGEGFTNYSGLVYPSNKNYNSYNTYSLPFKQIIADSSISGASIMSGVYINNSFNSIGNNNLIGINHYKGQIYFTGNINGQISGNYAIKDFNIYLTNKSEEEIIFKTKFNVNPKTTQFITGLADNVDTIPAIFIKNNGGINEPFAFGGVDNTRVEIRCVVVSDNLYNLDAVCSILRDTAHEHVTLISSNEIGLDNMGNLKSGHFNYINIVNSKMNSSDKLYIEEVRVSRIPNIGTEDNVNIFNTFSAFIDFSLRKIR